MVVNPGRDPKRDPRVGDVFQDHYYGRVVVLSVVRNPEFRVVVSREAGRFPGNHTWDFQAFVKLLSHAKIIHAEGS